MPRVAATAGSPLAFELEEMSEHRLARHLKQIFLEPAIDQRHQAVWRRLALAQRRQDLFLTLAPMLEVLAQHGIGVVDHGTMRRKKTRRLQCTHALERRQIFGKVALQ